MYARSTSAAGRDGWSLPPVAKPIAVSTTPPTTNCHPLNITGSWRFENSLMRQLDIAAAMVERNTSPSPARLNRSAPPDLRFTRRTPAKPTMQPMTLRASRRSCLKASAASSITMKEALASMMELATPDARESPG